VKPGLIKGFGIESFTIAVLLRGVIGTIVIYIIKPWPVGISFDKYSFKKLISFGIPFQTNSILALLKDDLLFVYLGKVLPFSQVGYIGFAQKWAFMPLRLVMDNVIRIMFPSFSRLQHEPDALRVAVEKALFLVSLFIFPTAVGLILFSPSFIQFVPKYQKWEPALLSLTFFALNTVFSSISTPLTNFLNSTGRVKITLYFMVFWTTLTWISTLILLKTYGYNGVAIASFIVSLTSVGVIIISRRYVKFSLISPIFKQVIAALIMGAVIYFSLNFITSLITLFIAILFAGCVYLLVLLVIARNELLKTSRFVLKTVRTKS
jgi:O-antigen/teichoic acid export membrane protein